MELHGMLSTVMLLHAVTLTFDPET